MANATKRQNSSSDHHQPPHLIPGLPDHVAILCLSRLPPSLLYSVCRSWRRLIYSSSFPPFLSLYALLSPAPPPQLNSHQTTTAAATTTTDLKFFTYDPLSSTWYPLPPPPPDPPLHFLLHHPSFVSRSFPIQSVSTSTALVVLAATAHDFSPALPRPLVFHPLYREWSFGPPLPAARRWCAAGTLSGTVYVASGMGSQFSTEVAKSVQKWEPDNEFICNNVVNEWTKLSDLRDGKFSRDAIEAVGWRGKICMVNCKGGTLKEGVIYNVERDEWEEMPMGLMRGWRGPVAAMVEEVMYGVGEVSGGLRKYDEVRDSWEEVLNSEVLIGAQHLVVAGGRACVVCRGGERIAVVDVTAVVPKIWLVEPPSGLQAVGVHILPRMISGRPAFVVD